MSVCPALAQIGGHERLLVGVDGVPNFHGVDLAGGDVLLVPVTARWP